MASNLVADNALGATLTSSTSSSEDLPDEFDSLRGTGRWQYVRKLGEGGLAMVYRAFDVTGPLGEVAIKVLRAGALQVHAFELHREAQWSLTRLHNTSDSRYDQESAALFVRCLQDHSGFAAGATVQKAASSTAAFESRRKRFEADDFNWCEMNSKLVKRPYIVLELLPGEALHLALLRSQGPPSEKQQAGPLSDEERQGILVQLAQACTYLCNFGLIHRDLRACNVQLCHRAPSLQVRVLDLGVAIAAEEPLRRTSNPSVCVFRDLKIGAGYDWLPWELRSGASTDADDRERSAAIEETVNFEWPAHSFDAFSWGVLCLEILLGKFVAREVAKQLGNGQESPALDALDVKACNKQLFSRLLGRAADRPSPMEVLGRRVAIVANAGQTGAQPNLQPIKKRPLSLVDLRITRQPTTAQVEVEPAVRGKGKIDELAEAEESLRRMAASLSTILSAKALDFDGRLLQTRAASLLQAVRKCWAEANACRNPACTSF